MSVLWRWVIQRRLIEERLRTALTILGVALGVAVFVSIRLASRSAMGSFSDTVDAVAGRANLEVTSLSNAFDERLFPLVRRFPGVRAAAPVVEVTARAHPGGPRPESSDADTHARWPETLLILGLDVLAEGPFGRAQSEDAGAAGLGRALLTDPRAIAITRTLAGRHGLAIGDSVTVLASGRPVALIVRQVLESKELQHASGGNVAIVDIATAQEVFERYGRLDRIDLIVDPVARDSVRAALARVLPAGATVALPQGRTRQVESMVSAFELNLTALSFIALFVATFLIFNAVAMSVLRWRAEIGILRALGTTRRTIAALFLAEGASLGLIGGLLGLPLGTLFARGTLAAVSRTLTDLYLVNEAARLRPEPGVYLGGLLLGVAIALLSALLPALEAARTPPGVTMRQGILIEARRISIGRWTLAGFASLLIAAAAGLWTVRAGQPLGGFASAFLTLVAFALAAPAFTLLCERLAGGPIRRLFGIEGALGARYLREAIARTSVAVAALMVSVGMLVALTVMVGSFRRTVDTWITQTIRGDLYVEPVGHHQSTHATALPTAFVDAVRALPGVVAVDSYRGTRIDIGGRLAFIAGVDFDVQRRLGRLQFVHGDSPRVLARAIAGDGAIVTESFAHHHRVAAGDTLTLDVPAGRVRLPIEGVYYDYTTDAGAIMVDRHLFARLWNDPRTESVAIYLGSGADADQVRRRVIAIAGPDLVLSVTPNHALRERVLEVFDQTFQITYALQGISVLVAVLGVIGTLTALILQRGREIGVLRAIGASRRQVRKMVVIESAMIGLIGALLGCLCGMVLALILVHIINRQFFGWTIRMTVTPDVFIQAILLMTTTAAIAGIWPARLAASRVAAEAMRVE